MVVKGEAARWPCETACGTWHPQHNGGAWPLGDGLGAHCTNRCRSQCMKARGRARQVLIHPPRRGDVPVTAVLLLYLGGLMSPLNNWQTVPWAARNCPPALPTQLNRRHTGIRAAARPTTPTIAANCRRHHTFEKRDGVAAWPSQKGPHLCPASAFAPLGASAGSPRAAHRRVVQLRSAAADVSLPISMPIRMPGMASAPLCVCV